MTYHSWKVLHDLIFTRVQHYADGWFLTKTSITNLKKFTVDSINDLDRESNLSIFSIRPKRFFKILSTQFQRAKTSEKDFVLKTAYSVILANNTTGVFNQLFRCGRVKLAPIGNGHLQLLLVWLVGCMDPHITGCVTKPSQVPWTHYIKYRNFT